MSRTDIVSHAFNNALWVLLGWVLLILVIGLYLWLSGRKHREYSKRRENTREMNLSNIKEAMKKEEEARKAKSLAEVYKRIDRDALDTDVINMIEDTIVDQDKLVVSAQSCTETIPDLGPEYFQNILEILNGPDAPSQPGTKAGSRQFAVDSYGTGSHRIPDHGLSGQQSILQGVGEVGERAAQPKHSKQGSEAPRPGPRSAPRYHS